MNVPNPTLFGTWVKARAKMSLCSGKSSPGKCLFSSCFFATPQCLRSVRQPVFKKIFQTSSAQKHQLLFTYARNSQIQKIKQNQQNERTQT